MKKGADFFIMRNSIQNHKKMEFSRDRARVFAYNKKEIFVYILHKNLFFEKSFYCLFNIKCYILNPCARSIALKCKDYPYDLFNLYNEYCGDNIHMENAD